MKNKIKKLVILLFALFSVNAHLFADGLTATLQQGDVMTPFYGVDAFKNAYAAAQDGAVITLSSGKFNNVSVISKQIKVIGAYAFDVSSPEVTIISSLSIGANQVKVEGIYIDGNLSIGSVTNCHIKRCWVNGLTSSSTHINTLIDECVIVSDNAIHKGNNYSIKNSTIGSFNGNIDLEDVKGNTAFVLNCVIWNWYPNSARYIKAIFKNNIICIPNTTASVANQSSEFYNNLFLNTYSISHSVTVAFPQGCIQEDNKLGGNYTSFFNEEDIETFPASDLKNGTTMLGQDGTPIGIKGGTGFSKYPAIPRIISKTIDSNSDAEGKISVKITVKAEQ